MSVQRAAASASSVAALLAWAAVCAAASAPAGEVAVLVEGYRFQPAEVEVAATGVVTWTLGADPEQHTVSPRKEGAFADSGQLFTGDTWTLTFDVPGTFAYFCRLHPTMTGTVRVLAAASASPTARVTDRTSAEPPGTSGTPGTPETRGTPAPTVKQAATAAGAAEITPAPVAAPLDPVPLAAGAILLAAAALALLARGRRPAGSRRAS